MAICVPNFNPLASVVSEIQPLKLLFSEISFLQYGVSFAHSDAVLVSLDSRPQGLPAHVKLGFLTPTL